MRSRGMPLEAKSSFTNMSRCLRAVFVISTDEKIYMLLTDLVKARDIALAVQKHICKAV